MATHKDLYKPLLSRLAPTLSLGLGITTFMFLFTYLPQVAVLVFTSGPLAALTTILLVLSESSTLTMVLSKALLIEDSLIDTFDGTLIAKGQPQLVQQERQVNSGRAGDAIARLGKLVSKPFAKFTPQALVRYFMYLPLNLIPVVGTIAFVVLQGRKNGPNANSRYFQLKGMNSSQKDKFVEERQGAYTGYVSILLDKQVVRTDSLRIALVSSLRSSRWFRLPASSLLIPISAERHCGRVILSRSKAWPRN